MKLIFEASWVSALTWHLQLVAQRVRLKATQPRRVFLQVSWLFLEPAHGRRQRIYLPQEAFISSLLKQRDAFRAQQFLHLFSKFLQQTKIRYVRGFKRCTTSRVSKKAAVEAASRW